MAVVSAPLLSFGASGSIAKTQVYATWKGRPYARRHVVPSDPRSSEQVITRTAFSFLSSVWKIAPSDVQAPWVKYASGLVMTDRNAFLKKNLPVIRSLSTLDGFIMSPGAAGGLAVVATITPGSGTITITATAPDPLPSGWTVVKFVGAAIRDQDPQSGTLYTIHAGTDSSDPYSVALSGLAAGDWQAAGWFVYQRSASATDLAYGPGDCEVTTVT